MVLCFLLPPSAIFKTWDCVPFQFFFPRGAADLSFLVKCFYCGKNTNHDMCQPYTCKCTVQWCSLWEHRCTVGLQASLISCEWTFIPIEQQTPKHADLYCFFQGPPGVPGRQLLSLVNHDLWLLRPCSAGLPAQPSFSEMPLTCECNTVQISGVQHDDLMHI